MGKILKPNKLFLEKDGFTCTEDHEKEVLIAADKMEKVGLRK